MIHSLEEDELRLRVKTAETEVRRLQEALHEMTGLWYGACAARTEKAVELALVYKEAMTYRERMREYREALETAHAALCASSDFQRTPSNRLALDRINASLRPTS